jgi:hypothetical protein
MSDSVSTLAKISRGACIEYDRTGGQKAGTYREPPPPIPPQPHPTEFTG